MKNLTKLIDKVETGIDQDLKKDFDTIIRSNVTSYVNNETKDKQALKSFFEDMQKGGCQSGFIGEFVYHNDCKDFYIKHIDALEDFKTELEDSIGEAIRNRQDLPHYTFMCWLVFEEYCYLVYNGIFE